jgi:hypothetical protein
MLARSPAAAHWQCVKRNSLRSGNTLRSHFGSNTALKRPDPIPTMTIEQFLEFADTRPDGEKWELAEGVAVLSPSPVDVHQIIVANIVTELLTAKRRNHASWLRATRR